MNKEPIILAIETSGRIGSVALAFGEKIVVDTSFSGFLRHSAEIFPSIEGLLNEFNIKPDKITHLYISNGPGSFTGLRIAVSLAKMMYLAHSIKIIAVDSLDVTAFNALEAIKEIEKEKYLSAGTSIDRIAAILDAKRGQFFIAEYNVMRDGSGLSLDKLTDDYLMSAGDFCEKVTAENTPIWLLGDGLLYHRKEFKNGSINFLDEKYWCPRAACVYQLGWKMAQENQFADPLTLRPNYLYRPEIRVKLR